MNARLLRELGEQAAAIGHIIHAMEVLVDQSVKCDAIRPTLRAALTEARSALRELTIELHAAGPQCEACGSETHPHECLAPGTQRDRAPRGA